MEKPKTKKLYQQTLLPPQGRCCGPWLSTSIPITPKKIQNAATKNSNNRQSGDTKALRTPNPPPLQSKYGVFQNQANFTKPSRPVTHQKSEQTAATQPRRSRILAMNAHVQSDKGLKYEPGIPTRNVLQKKPLYHHLSLSEVMHIDIKPPNRSNTVPVNWISPKMNPRYHVTPTRGQSTRAY